MSEPSNIRRAAVMALLDDELKLQEKHLQLLRRQKAALIACKREEFSSLHDQHEDLLCDLELQEKHRNRCFPSGARLKSEVESWPEEDRDRAAAAMVSLRDLTCEIGKQSKLNQVLISNDLKLINFQLQLFMTAVNNGFQYVSTGASVPVQGNRLINRVA